MGIPQSWGQGRGRSHRGAEAIRSREIGVKTGYQTRFSRFLSSHKERPVLQKSTKPGIMSALNQLSPRPRPNCAMQTQFWDTTAPFRGPFLITKMIPAGQAPGPIQGPTVTAQRVLGFAQNGNET